MYFYGKIIVDLKGTQLHLLPPKNFFGGLVNLVKEESWNEKVEQEAFKLMALAQAINRVLNVCGINNVIRLAVGKQVIYEDTNHLPNDYELAMDSLRNKIEDGLDLGYLDEFDLILEHDDGKLKYIIDFDIFREHRPGEHPILIKVTAVSSELKRKAFETEEKYLERTQELFKSQKAFREFRLPLQAHFEHFLEKIKKELNQRLGIDTIYTETETRVIPKINDFEHKDFADYGRPFYGYDAGLDLFYIFMWHDLLSSNELHMDNFSYVKPDGGIISDGGGIIDGDSTSLDSGGGGWLDSISDAFSDSGGGGDINGSCGGCGDGGCGGGCGD